MNYSLSGSSVHGISQARILEWVAISFSKGSPQPREQTALAGGFFTNKPPRKAQNFLKPKLICDSGGFIFIVSAIYAV